jgi:hypothetical protein
VRGTQCISVATLDWYCRSLKAAWRPHLERLPFLAVRFQTLSRIADSYTAWSKKTYNNNISVIWRAFVFGYYDQTHRSRGSVFEDNGAPIRTLHYPTYRWRTTLTQLPLR